MKNDHQNRITLLEAQLDETNWKNFKIEKELEDMKKEFLSKLERQNASILSSLDDEDDFHVPDMAILDPELMAMEKLDLLVHVQKIQMELEQSRLKMEELQKDKEKHETRVHNQVLTIDKLKKDIFSKETECKNWIAKIEQANELADDIIQKDIQMKELRKDLEIERNKRKQIESLFESVTEREKQLKQKLQVLFRFKLT